MPSLQGLRDLVESFRFVGQTPATAFPPVAEQALLMRAMGDEWARQQTMARAQAAYEGVYPDPLSPTKDGRTDAIKVNYIALIVDIAVTSLVGDPPDWELVPTPAQAAATAAARAAKKAAALQPPPPPAPMMPGMDAPPAAPAPAAPPDDDEPPEDPDADRLRAILEANEWPVRLLDHAHQGSTTGTPYFRLYPAGPGDKAPRLRVLDSECMTVYTDPRDVETVIAYWWTYNTREPAAPGRPARARRDRQRIERQQTDAGAVTWLITDEHSYTTNAGDPDVWITDSVEDWAYAWPPVDHCKNRPNPGSAYGLPDYDDLLIALVRELNQNRTNRQRIDRFHGSPLTVLTGATVDVLDVAPNAVVELPEGATLDIIYPKVDSTAAAGLAEELFEAICEMGSTPAIALGRADAHHGADPSGVALRMKMRPNTTRTKTKRTLYGPVYARVLSHLLELDGHPGRQIRLNWAELMPLDPLAERTVLKMDRDAGVLSKESNAEKLGYDYAVEQERIAAERAAAPPPPALAPFAGGTQDPRASGVLPGHSLTGQSGQVPDHGAPKA